MSRSLIVVTQYAESVVDGNYNDASVTREDAAVVWVPGVPLVAFPVYEQKGRQQLVVITSHPYRAYTTLGKIKVI